MLHFIRYNKKGKIGKKLAKLSSKGHFLSLDKLHGILTKHGVKK